MFTFSLNSNRNMLNIFIISLICILMGPMLITNRIQKHVEANHFQDTIINERDTIVLPEQHINIKSTIALHEHHNSTNMYNYIATFIRHKNKKLSYAETKKYIDYLLICVKRYKLNINNIIAIMYIESHFNSKAVSDKGCIGLMQINYNVWGDILKEEGIIKSKKSLYKPYNNIMAGGYIFRYYLNEGIEKGIPNTIEYAVARYVGTSSGYLEEYPKLRNHKYVNKWRRSLNSFCQVNN